MLRLAAVVAFASGCVVVARETTTTVKVGHADDPAELGSIGAPMLDVHVTGSTLAIRTARARICRAKGYDLQEDTEHLRAGFEIYTTTHRTGGGQIAELVLFAIFAPITVPVSALINFPYVWIRDGHTSQRRELVDDRAFACPVELAAVHVTVELPSGARVDATTDASGTLELAIPPTEPAGDVTVRGLGEIRVLALAPRPSPAPAADSP